MNGFNHFPQITQQLHNSLKQVVKRVATDMAKDAAGLAPYDTGFLSKSVYATGWWGSSYGKGVQKAGSLRLGKKGYISRRQIQGHIKRVDRQKSQEAMLFPEVPPPPDELTALVACAATYGIFVNYGTRHQSADPFWEPAIRIAQVNLDGQLAVVAAKLGEGGIVSGSIEVLE